MTPGQVVQLPGPARSPAQHVDSGAATGRDRALLLLILALASLLRLGWLSEAPPGINLDEAVHAYEAQCLLKTGRDQAGNPWPIFCHGCGPREQRSAPFIYLLIPVQAILGMSAWSTRLLPAVLGVATIPLVFGLVRRWYGPRAGLIAALLLAVSPWHVHLCRLGFEASICPFLLTAGLACLSSAVSRPGTPGLRRWQLATAGLCWGVLAWTYHAMRVLVPLLLLVGMVLQWRAVLSKLRNREGRIDAFAVATGLLVGLAPFLYASATAPEKAWGRASGEFVLNRVPHFGDAVIQAAQTYLQHFSASFLFFEGDPSPIQSVPGYGQVHLICALFMFCGLVRIATRWKAEPAGRLLLCWVLAGPVPPALTLLDAGHSLRAVGELPALQMLGGIGLDWLLTKAAARSRGLARGVVLIASLGLLAGVVRFGYHFFFIYPMAAGSVFGAEWPLAFAEVQRRQGDFDVVLVTRENPTHTGRLYLFWAGVAPSEYFAMPHEFETTAEGDVLVRLGKIAFARSAELPTVLRRLSGARENVRALVVERPGIPVPGTPLTTIQHSNGDDALVLYEVHARLR